MAVYRLINFFFLFVIYGVFCLPEQGLWEVNYSERRQIVGIPKTLYANSTIAVRLLCKNENPVQLEVSWILRLSRCANEYMSIDGQKKKIQTQYLRNALAQPAVDQFGLGYKRVSYLRNEPRTYSCGKDNIIMLEEYLYQKQTEVKAIVPRLWARNESVFTRSSATTPTKSRRKRDLSLRGKRAAKTTTLAPTKGGKSSASTKVKTFTTQHPRQTPGSINHTQAPGLHPDQKPTHPAVVTTWRDGSYIFVLSIKPIDENVQYNVSATVRMYGSLGYLSAADYPFLPFYGSMCVCYVILGLVWLVLLSCNWRDLLRIQFWIGGVILLGMLEKALFFAEYETVNITGKSVKGAVIFAEIISAAKRSLARMLVVIVSLGFGIVKPRLGPMLHKILGAGMLYFILSVVEGSMRALGNKYSGKKDLFASIPLAVVDAFLCWWIFTGLVQTTRTLRLRRNVVKLSLYRHFTNTLIFAVLASVAYMIWSIKMHKITTCLTDWKELWVDDAFWHLLFSVLLLVIMVLWRPSVNNRRYAFSPLLDAGDEGEDDAMVNEAFGVKLRQQNGDTKAKQRGVSDPDALQYKAEDDLKWVEENIPASIADTALPALLDSDEEIVTTKFEISKMQ